MPPSLRPDLSLLVLRLFATPIFVGAGLHHLLSPDAVAQRLASAPHAQLALALAPARTLVLLSGAALLAGGLGLLLGLFTRAAALGLLAVLVPITVTVQVGASTSGPLLKNVAIAGVLLHVALSGAGAYALDGLLARRRRVPRAATAIASAILVAAGAAARAVVEARQAGVGVYACGLTLEKKGIPAERLQAGVGVVPNGIVEALRLQAEGWLSLEL